MGLKMVYYMEKEKGYGAEKLLSSYSTWIKVKVLLLLIPAGIMHYSIGCVYCF